MIRLEALNIIISGNNRDDLLFEYNLLERSAIDHLEEPPHFDSVGHKIERKPAIDRKLATGPIERTINPPPLGFGNYNEIERKPATGPKVDEYESQILQALMRIAKSSIGAAILGAARQLPEPLYILPIGERDAAMMGGHMSKCLADEAHVSQTNPDDKVPPVKINPRDPKTCKPLKAGGAETDPQNELDSSLVHEMAHAVRPKTSPLWKKIQTGDPWLDFEEFFATVVQNIYKSERGDLVLRGGHDDSILPHDLATSEGFMKDSRFHGRVEKLYRAEPLAQRLGRVKGIKFNPFTLATGQKYGLELI